MKLVVRVLSDLVGGQDSVAEPGGTAFGSKDMFGVQKVLIRAVGKE